MKRPYTPGPWQFVRDEDEHTFLILGAGGEHIASVAIDGVESVGNTRLIQLLPDLLYWLRAEHGQLHMSDCDVCKILDRAEGNV